MKDEIIKNDCKHFKGDIPCEPHKQTGTHCENCQKYTPVQKRILILKQEGLGDVIRTTPILRKLKEQHPNSEITWLSTFSDVLPKAVDNKLPYNTESIIRLLADEFDYIYSLDKRIESCALANIIKAKIKKGFMLKNGKCAPIDSDANQKYLTGLFDDISKTNTKSYVEEIFDIAGLPYNKEKYWLDPPMETNKFPKMKSPVIGLVTGSGQRWVETRNWPEENWIKLITELQSKKYNVILLGGELEHEKNTRIASKSGAHYFGHFPIKEFIALMNTCDLIVTAVTSTMHFAIALEKKIALFVNIFPKAEFELYGLGEIIEPPKQCKCYFKPTCSEYPGSSCMKNITVETVITAIEKLLKTDKPQNNSQPQKN